MEQINLTNTLAGLAAIQRCMAGENILFTRLEIGDGVLTNTDISGMAELINKTSEFPLGAIQAEESEVIRLRSNISNKDINTDLVIREYGIYAKFGEEQEFLFAYLNVGESTTPLPSQRIGRYELNRDFVLYIGNSLHVDFTSNGHLVYVAVNEYKDDMNRKANVVGTIEDLKNSNIYEVGDIVEVLGFYIVGYGGHKRKKMPQGYVGKDAIIGIDGSIWGIEKTDDVNIDWFGAKENEDCYELIKKALDIAKTIIFSSGRTYICNGRVDLNNKRIKLGTMTVIKKDGGIDEPIFWCNGNNFVIEGNGLGSLITSTLSLTLGVVCVGNLGMDDIGRNVLYGNIRHLELSTPYGSSAEDGSCTISFVGPQYDGLANYFHHMDDVRITGGDSGVLMWGWANGNNFSNIHLYQTKTKGFYFKEIVDGNKHPLDNNIANVFHHTSPDAATIYMEGGSTNIITGLNCEQGGSKAQSVFMTKECSSNTFILSSNVSSFRTIKGRNNIIDSFGSSVFGNLELQHNYSPGDRGGLGFIREYNFNMANLAENTAYKLVKFNSAGFSRYESIIIDVQIVERNASGVTTGCLCSTKYIVTQGSSSVISKTDNSYELLKDNNDFYLVTKTSNNGTGTASGFISVNIKVQRPNSATEITTEQFEVYAGTPTKPTSILELNNPYHVVKMKEANVYDDFIKYMDSVIEYEKAMNKQINNGVSTLQFLEKPQPSENLLAFKKEYLG